MINLSIKKTSLIFLVILFSMFSFGCSQKEENNIAVGINETEDKDFTLFAENLNIPWEIVFLPNNEMLVTERQGNLLRIGEDKRIIKVEGVRHIGEGGLLGIALHPDFSNNYYIYLYFTSGVNGKIENRIERYKLNLDENKIEDKEIIISGIPGSSIHDGGRIEFGPDNYLYITTGDAGNPDSAQDINSLGGKILRISKDGKIPEDNPFNNEVYSYGHRNSQGIAWDDENRLWTTEHGRSGFRSGFDEINLIEKGGNYGWPIIQGDEKREGMISPVINSGEDYTWAPAGAVFYEKNIFFTGLKGEALYQYDIEKGTLREHFKGEFGRLRAIVLHDDFFYVSTSNRDGRGTVKKGDDKIIKINSKIFLT